MFADYFLASFMHSSMRRSLRFSSTLPPESWTSPAPESDTPLLLYLHVPFCEQLCPFCPFNRIKFDAALATDYFDCLRKEMVIYSELGYRFDSVYVGGGTPTIVPEELHSTLKLAKELWQIKRISAETNPNHLTPEILSPLRDLGIDRLSVGVQSFDDDVLRAIGRYDAYGSGAEIRERLATARDYFETLNVDLIFNFPMQNELMLLEDLATVKTTGADQITYYPLMSASEGTPRRRTVHGTNERRFYELIRRELIGSYESSSAWCFSRREPGSGSKEKLIDEYIVERDDYAGLGAGSFGYLQGMLYSNTFDIPYYIDQLNKGIIPVVARKHFSEIQQIRYYFLLKLFGGSLDLRHLSREFGKLATIRMWKELIFFLMAGAIKLKDRRLTLTTRGQYLWVVLMREFFAGVNIFREHNMSAIRNANTVPVKPMIASRYSSPT